MRARSSSRDPPAPAFFTKQQMGNYLKDIRTYVPSRPIGAREPPQSFVAQRRALFDSPGDAGNGNDALGTDTLEPSPRCTTFQDSRRPSAVPSVRPSHRGRPLVRSPAGVPKVELDQDQEREDEEPEPYIPYAERGYRWMEKQEVRSVSQALRAMDLKDDEKLFKAAQAEATELVWKHQNTDAPYRNPDQPYDYHAHLRKGSHARTMSWVRELSMSKRRRDGSSSRSVSNGSKSSGTNSSRIPSDSSMKAPASPITPVEDCFGDELRDPAKNIVHFAPSPDKMTAKKETKRKVTPPKHEAGNPDAEIKISNLAIAARVVSNAAPIHFRNPFARAKQAKGPTQNVDSGPVTGLGKFDKVEIQRNPPTQFRNPAYTTNEGRPSLDVAHPDEGLRMKDGMEVRSDDIRKATSVSLKGRSAKLPAPTMVSDSPGRPIVSFDKDWKPKDVQLQAVQSIPERTPSPLDLPDPVMKRSQTEPAPKSYPPAIPTIAIAEPVARSSTAPAIHVDSKPPIPTIAVNDAPSILVNSPPIPTIAVNDTPSISISAPTISATDVPSISVSDSSTPTISISTDSTSTRPLPNPTKNKHLPRPSIPAPPRGTNPGTLCATCALPISGRTVTASGHRFHPSCFTCHTCSEALEHVSFYPEPDSARSDRLCQDNTDDAADPSPRFYCALCYHELFSPRCKSCKTPIEGNVVVACGAEWHEGHFFCAECGDPFTASTPFVERDGYAWCVGCAGRRYAGRCRGCRRPILERGVVVEGGGEWCEGCWVCKECKGPFADGTYFLRLGGVEPFCTACEERRVKEMAG